jgi:uncharacterized protein (TIGR03435 family)
MTYNRIAAGLLVAACAAFPQTPAAAPAFEVATIKPAVPITPQAVMSGKLHVGMKIESGRADIGFMSLSDLIGAAYEVKTYQISGPDWMGSQRFDILAKMPEGASKEQVPDMLKALLAERFRLALHRAGKEHAIYALVVGKNGLKLKESPPDDVIAPAGAEAGTDPAPGPKPAGGGFTVGAGGSQVRVTPNADGKGVSVSGGENGKTAVRMGADGTMHMEVEKVTMPKFAEMLSRFAGRPVVDMTGLKGRYQIALDLSMQDMQAAAKSAGMGLSLGMGPGVGLAGGGSPAPADAASDPSNGSLFASVQQLGLKLEPKKDRFDSIVVDHVEKSPTEN